MIDEAYDEIIHWKRNIFLLPSGSVEKSFVWEITSLLQAFASGPTMEYIALKASFVMQILLLQNLAKNARSEITLPIWRDELSCGSKVTFHHSFMRGDVFSVISLVNQDHQMMMPLHGILEK